MNLKFENDRALANVPRLQVSFTNNILMLDARVNSSKIQRYGFLYLYVKLFVVEKYTCKISLVGILKLSYF